MQPKELVEIAKVKEEEKEEKMRVRDKIRNVNLDGTMDFSDIKKDNTK